MKLGKSEVPRKLFVLKNRKAQKTKKENLTIAPESENQTKRERIDTICQELGDKTEDLEGQTKMPSWVNLQSLDVELQKE